MLLKTLMKEPEGLFSDEILQLDSRCGKKGLCKEQEPKHQNKPEDQGVELVFFFGETKHGSDYPQAPGCG